MTRLAIDYFILDALANDRESFEDILRLVNHPEIGWASEAGGPIAAATLLTTLPRLVRDELVQVYVERADRPELEVLAVGRLPSMPLEACYFGLTARGQVVHGSWATGQG